jgi:hypothetical protein
MSEKATGRVDAQAMLRARPFANEAMERERLSDGRLVVSVPIRRPRYLVPPLSWLLPFSSHRRVELDPLGVEVLDRCDGRHTVESIVEQFASDHKLTFREAQLAVMQFLRQLTQRGLVAVVGVDEESEKR